MSKLPASPTDVPWRWLRAWAGTAWMPTPTNGLNPEAERSTVLFAHRLRSADNTGMALLLALMLHGTTSTAWPDEQLWPIRAVEYLPWAPSGAPCGVRLELADGRALLVDFGPDNAP